MASVEKKLVRWWDSSKGRPTQLTLDQLGEHLENIAQVLSAHVDKLEKVGDLNLDEIDVSLDVKGDALMVAVDGGIKLTFTKPKS